MQKNDNYYFEVFRPRIFVILSNFLYEIVQVLYSKQTCTRCPFCVDNVFCFKKVLTFTLLFLQIYVFHT